ncbi:MAG: septal ring lytic transglycosylase RlpA family protein [Spirochaetaceae bacterium]|nr:septal ring lytic transglycosylase RlpA family protein [Spirochaetaceae bacterium]
MKRIIGLFLCALVVTAICAAQSGTVPDSGFRQEGIASWYGAEFKGRPTASGEPFDPAGFTAAHPTLPFGTILRITNRHNNRQVMVRVNDRGPFVSARIIDLSQAAAEQLDMLSTGTAPVLVEGADTLDSRSAGASQVETLATAQPERQIQDLPRTEVQPVPYETPANVLTAPPVIVSTAPVVPVSETAASQTLPEPGFQPLVAPLETKTSVTQPVMPVQPVIPPADISPAQIKGKIPPAGIDKSYRLQVGAYKIPRNAAETFDKLKNVGLNPAYERNGDFYRVVLAGLRPEEIQDAAVKIGAAGFREAIIREE